MDPLASQDQVETILGRALTEAEATRCTGLLAAASARFRAEARQDFTAAETTRVLRVADGRVRLPLWPVTAVTAVHAVTTAGTAGAAIGTWAWDGLWTIEVGDWWNLQVNAPVVDLDEWGQTVQITWSHGYATIPDDVSYAVAGMVARAIGTGSAGTGVVSETIGQYSYRLGSAAESGALGMTVDEIAVARRYRRPAIGTLVTRDS